MPNTFPAIMKKPTPRTVAGVTTDIKAGMSMPDVLAAFTRWCKRPYETLWITKSWFEPRERLLRRRLTDPITEDEALALRDAVLTRQSLDVALVWMRGRRTRGWADFISHRQLYAENMARAFVLQCQREQYTYFQRSLWRTDWNAPLRDLGPAEKPRKSGGGDTGDFASMQEAVWGQSLARFVFCTRREPRQPETARSRAALARRVPACPTCGTTARDLRWESTDVVSAVSGEVESLGWAITCTPCLRMVWATFAPDLFEVLHQDAVVRALEKYDR